MINHPELAEAVRFLDKLLGHHFKSFNVAVAKSPANGNEYVKLTCNCRICGAELMSQGHNISKPGWGKRMVADFQKETQEHTDKHVIILPEGNA